jgi:hypothetical protein
MGLKHRRWNADNCKYREKYVKPNTSKCANPGLETSHQINKEWMSNFVCHFKDVSLRHETVDFITSNNITFFQRFDGKIFASSFVLRE